MSLEGKDEGATGASGGGIANGAKVTELKKEKKRRAVVSSEVGENSVVTRRILRSDVTKQRAKEVEEEKKKSLEESSVVLDLDSNVRRQNGIDQRVYVQELKAEKKSFLRLSSDGKRELGKTLLKKFSEKAAVRDYQDNGIEVNKCHEDSETESKSTMSLDDMEKREAHKIHLKRLTEEATGVMTCENDVEAQDNVTKLDFAKQMGKDGIEYKGTIDDGGGSEKIVTTEDAAFGTDHKESRYISAIDNGANQIKCEEEEIVETVDVSGGNEDSDTHAVQVGEVFDSYKKQVPVNVALGDGNNGEESKSILSERNDTEEKKIDEANRVECKTNMEMDVVNQRKFDDTDKEVVMVEAASEARHKVMSVVRNRKNVIKIRVENRRLTRSSTAKLMEESDSSTREVGPGDTDKERPKGNVSSEAVQSEDDCNISNQSRDRIEEMIVGSNICKKNSTGGNIEVGKRRVMRSGAPKQREEADSGKKRKKFIEPGLERKRSSQAFDVGVNRKKTKTDSSSCKRNQTEEHEEEKKLIMGSRKTCGLGSKEAVPIKRQKDGPNDKRIKLNLKNGCRLEGAKFKWSKHLGLMTLKQLKQNDGSPVAISKKDSSNSLHKKLKGRGRGRPSANKKMLGSEKSHTQIAIVETSCFKEISCETGIESDSLSPSKDPKNVDASCDRRNDMVERASITKQEKDAELRKARNKLRDQIKGLLFSAGWKMDLRPRNGKNYIDSVYIAPNGCTHWSILKAYYAFQKQFSPECDDKGKRVSGKLHKKSRKSNFPSFSPIPEEALSILKHPISRRRTKKEIEEAEVNPSKKGKKHKKYSKDKSPQKKGGIDKGRLKKTSIAGSSAKGAISTAGKKLHLGKNRKKQKGCALLVRSFNQDAESGSDEYVPYTWKRTTLSWMIDLGIVPENAAVKYMNQRRTKTLLKGLIKRDGIHCSCCSKIVTVSDFEIHAGSKKGKPYQNIFVEEDGTSLSQCQINAWEKQDKSERKGFYSIDILGDDPNDDTCGICGDGGDLICCDGCPSTFHQSCLGTEMLPPGNWYCMNCSCRFCALNSGLVDQGNGATDSPLLSCSQCEEKYHRTCVPEEGGIPVSSSQSGSSFCGQKCRKLFEKLRMLLGVKKYLDGGFSWTIVQRFDEDLPESVCPLDQRAECNSKIAVALAVMDECFLPIIDQRSGVNLIHNVVYNCGSNFNRLNYSGFYTFILEQNDEIISVASLRIHGTRVAEMPFIGTRNMYRRQGMCRRLLNEIESVLRSLSIEKLIIPAISELKDTWTNVFGFKLLEVSEKKEIRSINLLVFPGTGLLLKPLLEKYSAEHSKTTDEVVQLESESMHHHAPEAANELVLPTDVESESHASDDCITQHKIGVKHLEPSLSADSCTESHSNVSAKSSDDHVEFQAPELKSSEISAQKDLLVQPEAVSHDKSVTKSKIQKDSSVDLETKLTCDGTV